MKNKTLLILILIATLIALGGLFSLMLTYFKTGGLFLSFGLSLVNLLGLILLIRNSSLTKTIYFRFISFLIAIIIVGAMFKIMHWPGSAIMLIFGLLGIPSVYTFRFINKPIKRQLDIMKLVWVLTAYITALGVTMHWFPRDLTYLPNVIMLATIIHFAMTCIKDKELMES